MAATRGGRPIELCWVMLDAAHRDYAAAVAALGSAHLAEVPETRFSLNVSRSTGRALAKAAGVTPARVASAPWAGAVVRTGGTSARDRAADMAEVSSAGWLPEPEPEQGRG